MPPLNPPREIVSNNSNLSNRPVIQAPLFDQLIRFPHKIIPMATDIAKMHGKISVCRLAKESLPIAISQYATMLLFFVIFDVVKKYSS